MAQRGWLKWILFYWDKDPLQLLGLLLIAITAIFLFYYTIETLRIRKVAERQYRASFRPAIVVVCYQNFEVQGAWKLGLEKIALRNIGVGPALNVQMEILKYRHYTAEFQRIDFIPGGKEEVLSIFSMKDGTPSGLARHVINFEAMLLSNKDTADVVDLPIRISFEDLAGNHCETRATLQINPVPGVLAVKYGRLA